MKKTWLYSLVLLLLLAACTRSVGSLTPPAPATEAPPGTSPPLITLSPPATETPLPTEAQPKPTATEAATQAPPTQAPGETQVSAPTATEPLVTATATPTPGASPTATLPPIDTGESFGQPDFTDPMTEDSFGNWSRDNELPDTENIRLELEDGRLVVTGRKPLFDTWWFSWPVVEDFYLEMTVETGTCSGKDAYGVIFRGPPRDFGDTFGYIVAFSCDGSYLIRRVDSADPYDVTDLTQWTHSDHINTGSGETNRLGVRGNGSTLSVYANDYRIQRVMDNNYDRGRYGVFVSPAQTADFTFEVLEVEIWELE